MLPIDPDAECLEGPLMGVQFGTYAGGQGTADANFGANVDGNYGFGDGCIVSVGTADRPGRLRSGHRDGTRFDALPGGSDYLVEVEIPNDALGRPRYKVTREEDINIGNGDEFVPAVPPPACAGPLHIVDLREPDVRRGRLSVRGQSAALQREAGPARQRQVDRPVFHLFTDVPLPARFWGLIVDDLTFSADPRSLLYGEKAGIPFAPVGIYDYTDRLITTVESDFNGLFDVLLPSTNRINCPTPSGVCANLYRFVGNDPGVPGRLNLNYKPQFRTIAAEFEAIPGLLVPADLAPTQVGVTVQLPGGQVNSVSCALDAATPQLYAVNRPYRRQTPRSFTITGLGFGASGGRSRSTAPPLPNSRSSAGATRRSQVYHVPDGHRRDRSSSRSPAENGPEHGERAHHPRIARGSAPSATTRLSRGRAREDLRPGRVAPGRGRPRHPARARRAAFVAASNGNANRSARGGLPEHPERNPRQNPRGAYYENLIISSKVKLQGVGPGSPDGSVRGSIIDGGAFAGDSPVATDWYARIGTLTWAGNQTIYDGAVISIFLPSTGGTPSRRRTRPGPPPRSTASTCAAATSRGSPATST